MIRENQKVLNRFQMILDLLIMVAALFTAYSFRFANYTGDYLTFPYYLETLYLLVPLFFILYYFFGLYEPQRRKSRINELGSIIKANLAAMTILLSFLFFSKEVNYSRQVFFYFVLFNCGLTILERALIRKILTHIREKGYNKKFLLVVGADRLGRKLIRKIKENPGLGYEIVGLVDDQLEKGSLVEGAKVLSDISGMEEVIKDSVIDEVMIALPLKEYDKLKIIIKKCEKSGIRTNIIPDYLKYIPARPVYDEIDGLALLNIRYIPLDNLLNAWMKRTLDIVLSALALLICLPLFLILMVVIRLDSPGPVFFNQERVGLNQKRFTMYKFRSMKMQSESCSDTEWSRKNDPRRTKVGALLRKTSLDELPQLFNVLKGDMSLVGPRPERPFFVERFREKVPKYMIKHQVRPGITGWAQVNGWRGDTSIRKRIECDLYYIENWTLTLDIKIVFLTVFRGFINKNA